MNKLQLLSHQHATPNCQVGRGVPLPSRSSVLPVCRLESAWRWRSWSSDQWSTELRVARLSCTLGPCMFASLGDPLSCTALSKSGGGQAKTKKKSFVNISINQLFCNLIILCNPNMMSQMWIWMDIRMNLIFSINFSLNKNEDLSPLASGRREPSANFRWVSWFSDPIEPRQRTVPLYMRLDKYQKQLM